MSKKKEEIVDAAPPAPEKQNNGKKPKREEIKLPFLVELVFQFSGFFLLLITLSVALISYLSGAHFIEIFIRTGAALVVCGFLTLILSSRVSQGAFEAAAQMEEAQGSSEASVLGSKDIKA